MLPPSVSFLGEQECAFDHIDARLPAAHDHFDDVEAEIHLGPVEQPQPGPGAARDEFLLGTVHRIGGAASLVTGARFHFGKDERVVRLVPQHEVHLSPALRAEVAVKDLAAFPTQELLGELLAAAAQRVARVRARVPPGGREEKSGDESEKAHAS